MEFVHYSVMRHEVLQFLVPPTEQTLLVDATVGEGGHSLAFLQQYPDLRVTGLDADATMIERARQRLAPFGSRVHLQNVWFDTFFSRQDRSDRPALILFDLGISSYHFKSAGRGFSFMSEEDLDMRLDTASSRTAADIVNTASERELADIIFRYGEERYSRRIAERIVRERQRNVIRSSTQLADIVWRAVPAEYRHRRIHPATKTFQAIRIATNDELGRLERGLENAIDLLVPGGKIGVISFHSLEDRIVKGLFRRRAAGYSGTAPISPNMNMGKTLTIVTKKPLRPTEAEVQENSASRSARLRVAAKVND